MRWSGELKRRRKKLSRKVSIRFGKEDMEIIKRLETEKGWDRSRAVRHVIRLVGAILEQGRLEDIEEILEDEIEIPEKCPECNAKLFVRANLNEHIGDAKDELWECANHHLFQIIYRPVAFRKLVKA